MAAMDKNLVKQIAADIEAALSQVAKKHSVGIRYAGATYDPAGNATIKLDVGVVSEGGVVMTKERANWAQWFELLGFKESDLGREFTMDGLKYIITGATSGGKVCMNRLKDGRNYTARAFVVLKAMGR